jgi:hypothetical protein
LNSREGEEDDRGHQQDGICHIARSV